MKAISQCSIEDSFFCVSRFIVGQIYGLNFFTKSELKTYLDLCRVKNTLNGLTSAGHKSYMNQFGYINPKHYKRFISRLIKDKFLIPIDVIGKIKRHGVLFPPLIHGNPYKVIQLHPQNFMSQFYMNAKRHNYIRLPKESFLPMIIDMTLKEINVLLKLYRYNGLSTFGGCEDTVINNTNGFYLHENFYKDIYITHLEAEEIINKFVNDGLATWVKVVKEETIIDGRSYFFYISDFSPLKTKLAANHKVETVLRLNCQPPLINEDDHA